MASLEELTLPGNDIQALSNSLSDLSDLGVLQLQNNSLAGPFPGVAFAGLEKLQILDLSHNLLAGALPKKFVNAKAPIVRLSLAFNKLTGAVPTTSLCALPLTLGCHLEGNNFNDTTSTICGGKCDL
jgi:hypothetical protein